jgi:HD domain-containing protein
VARLRWSLRVYVFAVMAAALAALAAAESSRGALRPSDTVLLTLAMLMATAAQLWPVHMSAKLKLTVEDTATFAAALLLGPFYAMLAAGASSLIAQHFRGLRQRWYNRGFNAAASTLATGAAGTVYLLLADPSSGVGQQPLAVVAAGATKYFVHTTLVDGAVSLQLRRSLIAGWWRTHRRLIPYEAALLTFGALAAIAAQAQPWTLLLFAVPMAVLLLTLRDSARARERSRSAVLEIASLIDERDPYASGRSQRVADLAEEIARQMKLSASQVERVRNAARLNDIGRIGTNDLALHEPGALAEADQREMRRHCDIGYRLLKRLGLREEAEIVFAHHERPDGRGYPRGLSGDHIPVEVSVVSLAATYEAMSHDRPYRKGLPWEPIRGELMRLRGRQWPVPVVDTLVRIVEDAESLARIDPASKPKSAMIVTRRALP